MAVGRLIVWPAMVDFADGTSKRLSTHDSAGNDILKRRVVVGVVNESV